MEPMKQKKNKLNQIAKAIKEPDFDRVLVACHRSPDGDACGSAVALCRALRLMGKKAKIFCPDPFGKEFSYLLDAEPNEDFEPERFITVDVAAPEMLVSAPFLDRIDVCLDHHRINSVKAKLKCVSPDSASCAELILDLVRILGLEPDRHLALAVYTGLATDTGLFCYSNTNENTYLAAAYLSRFVEEGDFYRINKRLFETKSLKRLALESYAASQVRFLCDGKVAYVCVPLTEQEKLGASYSELDVLINVIRQIEGVVLSLSVKEREAGEFKVSVRSEEGIDAAAFCAVFGGGGHFAAAGCTLVGTEQAVLARLLSEAERVVS